MLDKKKTRTTPDSEGYDGGFPRRPDLAKLYWEGRSNGMVRAVSGPDDGDQNARIIHNSNTKYRAGGELARKENERSFVPLDFRPSSSMNVGAFQSPVSPCTQYESEPYGCNHHNPGTGDSCIPYNHKTSFRAETQHSSVQPGVPHDLYRPRSSLAMASFQSPETPCLDYVKQRRGSISDLEENSGRLKLKSGGSHLQRKSCGVPSEMFDTFHQLCKGEKVAKFDVNKNGEDFFQNKPPSISNNIWPRNYKTSTNIQYKHQDSSVINSKRKISRSDAFDAATRFDDSIKTSQCIPTIPTIPTLPICEDYNQQNPQAPSPTRRRHQTLPYSADLTTAEPQSYSNGSNEDLERVLRELDNTGYFSEVIDKTSHPSARVAAMSATTKLPKK